MRELSTKEINQVSGGLFLLKGLLFKKKSIIGGLFSKFRYKKRSHGCYSKKSYSKKRYC